MRYNNPHPPLTPQQQQMLMQQQQQAMTPAMQQQQFQQQQAMLQLQMLQQQQQQAMQGMPQQYMMQQQFPQQGQQYQMSPEQQYALRLQMAQRQQGHNNQMQQQMMQQQGGGRFSQGQPAALTQGLIPQQQMGYEFQQEEQPSRYSSQTQVQVPTPKPEVLEVKEPLIEEVPTTKPGDNYKFIRNNKKGVRMATASIDPEQVTLLDSIRVTTSTLDTIEGLQEDALSLQQEDPSFEGVIVNAVIVDDRFPIKLREDHKKLFSNDARSLYRQFKKMIENSDCVEELVWCEKLNRLFTQHTNNYLLANLGENVNIDSFIEDFNDLLRVLRDNVGEDFEDDLLTYLDNHVSSFKQGIENSAPLDGDNDEDKKIRTYLQIPVLYVPRLLHVTTLKNIKGYGKIEDRTGNEYIYSLTDIVLENNNDAEFLMVTRDLEVFKIFRNSKSELLVKRIDLDIW